MRNLLSILFVFISTTAMAGIRDTVPTGAPQLFGSKVYEFRNYVVIDSFIMNKGLGINYIPRWPALTFNSPDRRWYVYDSTSWKKLLIPNDTLLLHQDLQSVTDKGNKTLDTIINTANRTQRILPDTADQPEFEIDVFPDTQGEVQDNTTDQFYSQCNWVASNRVSQNIKAVIGLGDITNFATDVEWRRADTGYRIIKNLSPSLPHIIPIGNHDYDDLAAFNRLTVKLNTYFGLSYYAGEPYAGNAWNNKTENYYIKFDVGAYKFLVISLEFIPRDSAMQWAMSVMDSFPDRKVIVATHAYLTTWGERATDTSHYSAGWFGNDPESMWQKYLRKKKNLLMVLGGHFIDGTEEIGGSKILTDVGDNGNIVHQIFVNYQFAGYLEYPNSSGMAGLGYFMRMRINPQTSKVSLSYFSPFLNQYDPNQDTFYLDVPPVVVEGLLTAKEGLYVPGVARFDSSVMVSKLTKWRLPIIENNGLLDTLSNGPSGGFLASTGIGTRPAFRTLLSADIPSGSSNYIQNQTSTAQSAGYYITGNSFMATNGYQLTPDGLASKLTLAGTTTNQYGLCVQSNNSFLGAAIQLYKTTGSTVNVKQSLSFLSTVGSISWAGVYPDNSTVGPLGRLRVLVNRINSNSYEGGFSLDLSDTTGVLRSRMYIGDNGWIRIGGSSANGAQLDVQTGDIAIRTGAIGIRKLSDGTALDVGGSVKIKKDSVVHVTSLGSRQIALLDTADNSIKRGLPADVGVLTAAVTSINSQTGATQTLSAGPGLNISSSSDTHTFTLTTTDTSMLTDVNNSGTSETDLYSRTEPANKLTLGGQALQFTITGSFNDATATNQIRGYFAGTEIFNSGALVISGVGDWQLVMIVTRATSTTARCSAVLTADSVTITAPVKYTEVGSIDWTATNIYKVTGTAGGAGGGSNDITAHVGKIIFIP